MKGLVKAYGSVTPGNPLDDATLMGPLHNKAAVDTYVDALNTIQSQGGKVLYGGKVLKGNYVQPTIVEISPDAPIVQEEKFVPIMYVMKIKSLEEAIHLNNNVP